MPRQEGLTYGSGVKSEYVRLELHRKQMIEREQHDEQHQANTKADADQLLLHGQQGLDVAARRFRFQIGVYPARGARQIRDLAKIDGAAQRPW